MKYKFDYSKEKDLVLKETRSISFENVIKAYKQGKTLADLKHTSEKRPNQKLLVVQIGKYAYVAPYVIDEKRKTITLEEFAHHDEAYR